MNIDNHICQHTSLYRAYYFILLSSCIRYNT